MTSTLIFAANLALELAILWRLVRLGCVGTPLGVFIGWLGLHSLVALTVKPLLSPNLWSWTYWLTHAVTYVLVLTLVAPVRVKSLPGVYWLTGLVLSVTVITNVWLYDPGAQYVLAVVCGLLALFCTLIGYVSHVRLLPAHTWLGVALWNIGQVTAGSFPRQYAIIYAAGCAVSLAFLLSSTYVPQPLPILSVRKLDYIRLPLSPRFLRKLLPV